MTVLTYCCKSWRWTYVLGVKANQTWGQLGTSRKSI